MKLGAPKQNLRILMILLIFIVFSTTNSVWAQTANQSQLEQRIYLLEKQLSETRQQVLQLEQFSSELIPRLPPQPQNIPIDKSSIIAFHNDYRKNPDTTLDGNSRTFWHSDDLGIGYVRFLAYKFPAAKNIFYIELINAFANIYALGELRIMICDDSTNGDDGHWKIVKVIQGNTNAFNGRTFIKFDSPITAKWIKLEMRYEGRGAFGRVPAFYLSDINFYQ